MKIHAAHSKLVETQDLLDMLALFPDPAEYDDLYSFGRPHSNPKQPVVDLTVIEDMEEFEKTYLSLMQEKRTGRWIHYTDEQGMFLLSKYYPSELRSG